MNNCVVSPFVNLPSHERHALKTAEMSPKPSPLTPPQKKKNINKEEGYHLMLADSFRGHEWLGALTQPLFSEPLVHPTKSVSSSVEKEW